jgi:ribosome biogenesis GTPase
VVDTPGFSDATHVEIELRELAGAFPEFAGEAEGCRFRGCTHLHEPGCTLRDAVEEGRVAASRFESYRAMAGDLQDR